MPSKLLQKPAPRNVDVLPCVRPLSVKLGDHLLIAKGPLAFFGSQEAARDMDEYSWKTKLSPDVLTGCSTLYLGLFASDGAKRNPKPLLLAMAKIHPKSRRAELLLPNIEKSEGTTTLLENYNFGIQKLIEEAFIAQDIEYRRTTSKTENRTFLIPQESTSEAREKFGHITRIALNKAFFFYKNIVALPEENPVDKNLFILSNAHVGI